MNAGRAKLISVIMPVYSARRYVAAAVRSVLTQRNVDLELVVVDNGSIDGSIDVVRKFDDRRIRVVDGPRRGIAEALNVGLDAARGDIIARCDSDDVFASGRLAFQAAWLREHPEFGAVCGNFTTISRFGFHLADMGCGTEPTEITQELREGTLRTSFCTFATRACFLRELGGFRPFFRSAEDVDLQLRLSEICRIWYRPRVVYSYRIHDASFTHQASNSEQRFYEACARWLQRQRAGGQSDELQRNCPSRLLTDPVESVTPRPRATTHVQQLLLRHAWQQHAEGRRVSSVVTGMRAGLSHPLRLAIWRSVLALMFKPPAQVGRNARSSPAPATAVAAEGALGRLYGPAPRPTSGGASAIEVGRT